jgi:hypothetical protein
MKHETPQRHMAIIMGCVTGDVKERPFKACPSEHCGRLLYDTPQANKTPPVHVLSIQPSRVPHISCLICWVGAQIFNCSRGAIAKYGQGSPRQGEASQGHSSSCNGGAATPLPHSCSSCGTALRPALQTAVQQPGPKEPPQDATRLYRAGCRATCSTCCAAVSCYDYNAVLLRAKPQFSIAGQHVRPGCNNQECDKTLDNTKDCAPTPLLRSNIATVATQHPS